jgi:hypothetical protein
MNIQKAKRKQAKIKLGLQGPSGSGKTYSSLQVAYGLCGSWSKIAVVDTENSSAALYAHLGQYNIVELGAPHTPERYIQAIETCETAGMEVIILDSTTHEWEYLLDYHASLSGNSFTNWSKVTPRHNAFIQKILSSQCHIICTVRTKTDYILTEKNGKQIPEKVGLKSVQRDGLDYEMTLVFDLDVKNNAVASKDRTGLFLGKPEQRLSAETGRAISDWCNSGDSVSADDICGRINTCMTIKDLVSLYKMFPQFQESMKAEFEKRKRELVLSVPDNDASRFLSNLKTSQNGTH